MESEISRVLPSLDTVIIDYSVGFLTHAVNSSSPDADIELVEAISSVTQILIDAAQSAVNPAVVRELVEKLFIQLEAAHDGKHREYSSRARKLDQSIHLASQKYISSTMGLIGSGVNIDAVGMRKVESKVDKKKLEKAERKIKAKQDRKIMKNVQYEASRLVTQDDQKAYEDFYMAVNPLTLDSAVGKSKDIKVENIDVTIGGLRILSDTSLTLSHGRRYGLVGKNGIGKSTLLRALSRREIAIPPHISILHVEQEVSLYPALFRLHQLMYLVDYWRQYARYPSGTRCRCLEKISSCGA